MKRPMPVFYSKFYFFHLFTSALTDNKEEHYQSWKIKDSVN